MPERLLEYLEPQMFRSYQNVWNTKIMYLQIFFSDPLIGTHRNCRAIHWSWQNYCEWLRYSKVSLKLAGTMSRPDRYRVITSSHICGKMPKNESFWYMKRLSLFFLWYFDEKKGLSKWKEVHVCWLKGSSCADTEHTIALQHVTFISAIEVTILLRSSQTSIFEK